MKKFRYALIVILTSILFLHFGICLNLPEHVLRTGWLAKILTLSGSNSGHLIEVLLLYALIIIWMEFTLQRTIHRDENAGIIVNTVLMLVWLALRTCRYFIPLNSLPGRYILYACFIPMIGLPIPFLYLTIIIDRPEQHTRLPLYFKMMFMTVPVLALLVITNDFHQSVFKFGTDGNGKTNYTYRPGFYTITIWIFIILLAAALRIFHLSRGVREQRKRALPFILWILFVIYCVGYYRYLPIFCGGDFCSTCCIFNIFFIELMMQTGLLPNNTRYRKLFDILPLDMQILSEDGQIISAAKRADPVSPEIWKALKEDPAAGIHKDKDTIIHANKITGGMVIWCEDISGMNGIDRELKRTNARLDAAHRLLVQEKNAKRNMETARAREQIYQSLETEISEKMRELEQAPGQLPEEKEARKREWGYIALLLCNIKRRCHMFFLTQSGTDLSGEDLTAYLNELSDFASYAGISSLVQSTLKGNIPVARTLCLYEFFFNALLFAMKNGRMTLLCQLDSVEGVPRLRLLSDERIANFTVSAELEKVLTPVRGHVEAHRIEDMGSVSVTLAGTASSSGGEADDGL